MNRGKTIQTLIKERLSFEDLDAELALHEKAWQSVMGGNSSHYT